MKVTKPKLSEEIGIFLSEIPKSDIKPNQKPVYDHELDNWYRIIQSKFVDCKEGAYELRAVADVEGELTLVTKPSEYLNCKQAADYLGVSLSVLRKHQYLGTGPRFTKQGQLRGIGGFSNKYKKDDLDRWSAQKKQNRDMEGR